MRLGFGWVYPRVGGATPGLHPNSICHLGLSPRGRGNPSRPRPFSQGYGSIPAWAGQPKAWPELTAYRGVYPRVGGATAPIVKLNDPEGGLSPRGRGNRSPMGVLSFGDRSIPAWAGQPGAAAVQEVGAGVYPRVGGATESAGEMCPFDLGLSPRGRGNQCRYERHPN